MKNLSLQRMILILGLLLISWINLYAYDAERFEEGPYEYEEFGENSVMLVSCKSPSEINTGDVCYIPTHVTHEGHEYIVESIGISAFANINEIRKVVVGEGVEIINNNAFYNCVNLDSIYIPSTVIIFDKKVFGRCRNLRRIVVDAENECFDSRYNCNAVIDTHTNKLLAACPNTKIPPSVKTIGNSSFYNCIGLEELDIPEGVELIESFAFEGCCDLKRISLPQSLVTIAYSVFENCTSLKSLYFPKNVTNLSTCSVWGCVNLTNIIVDKDNPEYDSRYNCNGVVRKSDTTLIVACPNTKFVDGIKRIESDCFSSLNLHYVHIPASVVDISENPFVFCSEIDSITVDEANPVYKSPKGSNAILSKDGKKLLVGCRTTIIPDGVEEIGKNAFSKRSPYAYSLHLPEGIKKIGECAFSHNYSFDEVVLPHSVEEIGPDAFRSCYNLKVVNIKSNITTIHSRTFSDCPNLSYVNLPEGLESINHWAFENCKSLKSLKMPSTIKKVDPEAFKGCPLIDIK